MPSSPPITALITTATTAAMKHLPARYRFTTLLFRLAKSGETLFAVGGEGKIFYLNGEAWNEVDHGRDIRLYLGGIEALQNNRIIVAGPSGTLHILIVDEIMGNGSTTSVLISASHDNNKE